MKLLNEARTEFWEFPSVNQAPDNGLRDLGDSLVRVRHYAQQVVPPAISLLRSRMQVNSTVRTAGWNAYEEVALSSIRSPAASPCGIDGGGRPG